MKKGLLTGLLLFGFFFGAGNLIFPPSLGLFSGEYFWPAVAGFILSGVGIPIITLIVGATSNGSFKHELETKVHSVFAVAFLAILYLSIGPFFAIPRTATVSYSISIQPFESALASMGISGTLSLFIYTVLYFAAAYWIAIHRSTILNSIGKILTPLFAGLILILVLLGAIKYAGVAPMEAATAYQNGGSFGNGFIEGYNTLDALASVAFCVVAVNTLKKFHFSSKEEFTKTIIGVGLVTAVGFSILYLGLANLGNHFTVPADVLADKAVNKGSYILAAASKDIFGVFGQVFLGAMVILTCFTTTVGLIVSTGEFFEELFPKYSYKVYATVFSLIGFGISNLGLNTVIKFSIPVLLILYPITIIMVILIILNRFISLSKVGMQLTVGLTVLVSVLTVLGDTLKLSALTSVMNQLPFSTLSLGWVVPALVGIVIAFVLSDKQKGEVFDFEKILAE